MSETATVPLTATRIGGSFVADVTDIDVARNLDTAWDAIHAAYLEHKILAFHGQQLTAKQFHDFGERFGVIEPHTVAMYHHEEFPGITVLSNRVEMGRPKGIRDAGSHWHSDYSYKEIPANVTMLYALEIPNGGGDTMFTDLAAAYKAFPEAMKRRLDGLKALHHYRHTKDRDHPEGRWRLLSEVEQEATPEVVHPVVRTHPETGEKSIFAFPGITSGIQHILGMNLAESKELLAEIYAHCTDRRFRFTHKWQVGDLLLWDNRCTMHHATTDILPADQFRTIYRINTRGTRPV
ncbi:MAG: TauD/TfdA family dioxygenase [Alphaproteobacteria bacterium]|nr:TauD/TfdA family dioxygenase [Alphaproteobacteria bacterium]